MTSKTPEIIEANTDVLLPGDIGFVRGSGLLAKPIRWFETDPGEEPTWPNHQLTFTKKGSLYTAECIEALWHVKEHVWYKAYSNKRCELEVWRYHTQTPEQIQREVEWLKRQVGNRYGWWKLITLGLKRLTGIGFDKIHFLESRPICSVLSALGKDKGQVRFGRHPMCVTPDNAHDHVRKHEKWSRVLKISLNGGA